MLLPDSPFFLSSIKSPSGEIWFKNMPMGINKLSNMMKSMAAKAGLTGRFTNHSVRKTMCSSLLHSGVHPNEVAQLSGHKNTQSLNAYSAASLQQQQQMSNILQQRQNTTSAPTAATSSTVTDPLVNLSSVSVSSRSSAQQASLASHTTSWSNQNQGIFGGVLANCTVSFNGNVTFNVGK